MNRTGAILVELLLSAIFLILFIPQVPSLVQRLYHYPDARLMFEAQTNRTMLELAKLKAQSQRTGLMLAELKEQRDARQSRLRKEAQRRTATIAKMRPCAGDYDYDCRENDGTPKGEIAAAAPVPHPKVGIRCSAAVTTDCYDERNLFHDKAAQ